MICCNCRKEFKRHEYLTEEGADIRIGDITVCSGCSTIQVVSGHTLMTLYTRPATEKEQLEFTKELLKVQKIRSLFA